MLIINRKYQKLKNLLIMTFTIFVVLPILGLAFFVFLYANRIIENKIVENTLNSVTQTNLSIEKEINNIENYINFSILNEYVQSFLTNTDFTRMDSNLRANYLDMNQFIKDSLKMNELAGNVDILLIKLQSGFYCYDERIYLNEEELRKSEWYSDTLALMGRLNWIGMEKSMSTLSSDRYVFNVSRAIMNIDTFKLIGVIYMSIDESVFQPIFSKLSSQQSVHVINEEGYVKFSSDRDKLGTKSDDIFYISDTWEEGSFERNIDDNMYLFVYSKANRYGWRTICKIPLETLTGDINRMRMFTLIILIVCLAISLIFPAYIFKSLSRPLHYLVNLINEIQSESNTINIQSFPCYELIKLNNGVISLMEENKKNIQKLNVTEMLYRKTNLEKLEAQVNPHFLYNTLNSIKCIAIQNNQDTIYQLINSFTKLLRNCIDTDDEFISVREEIDNINHYMLINNILHENKIKFVVEVDEQIGDYLIPRFFLQPLVENSILHGLDPENSSSRISIKGIREKEDLIFEVADNGRGMDARLISRIMEDEKGDEHQFSRFGLRGTKERLSLLYGEKYQMNIESHEGKGTKTVIRVPIRVSGGRRGL